MFTQIAELINLSENQLQNLLPCQSKLISGISRQLLAVGMHFSAKYHLKKSLF